MVKQPYKMYDDQNDGPPPLGESWWEAILAEENGHAAPSTRRPAPKQAPAVKAPTSESVPVDWDLAMELYEMDRIVTLQVAGCNRGGLLVSGEGLHGFVPISHLVDMPVDKEEVDQDECLRAYSGRSLDLKVIECDPSRGRVVFSERAAQASPGTRNLLLHELASGQCVEGTVTNITDFGVFVDLGGVEGLIHVSEISWGRVRHPEDVVKYGERVRVHVINVEPERSRVALSMKRLYPNPWETAEERYFPGQITDAIITSLMPYGAFARLEEGLDGLIHVSEIFKDDPTVKPEEMVYEGQRVKVRVLHVDASKQRLGLSMILEE